MKKLSIALLGLLAAACILTGCKDKEDAVKSQGANEVVETNAAGGGIQGPKCSDETYAKIQNAYNALVYQYNLLNDYYINSGSVAQNDDVESLLSMTNEYITTLGDISQDSMSEEEAQGLIDSISQAMDGVSGMCESLGIMAEKDESDCSDASFKELEDIYLSLLSVYGEVSDVYGAEIATGGDTEIVQTLIDAAAYIETMGSITQESITENDAIELKVQMKLLCDNLSKYL